jgi:hypothetical protein
MIKYLLLLLISFRVYAEDFREHINLPACDTSNPKVEIIDTSSGFTQVNRSDKTIFCVKAGNYSATPRLYTKGTAEEPRYLIYFKEGETEETHPVNMDESDRVVIEQLRFYGTQHWVVDRITVRSQFESVLRIQPRLPYFPTWDQENNHITINRVLVEGSYGGAGQVAMGGDNVTIQDSVVRNSFVVAGKDDHCIVVYGDKVKVVHNELYNCSGDMIQVPSISEGGVIAYNDLYINENFYTDGNGNFDPNGDFMCAENGLDFKGGSQSSNTFPYPEEDILLVKGNKIWGFNKDDDVHCTSGSSSIGNAVTIGEDTRGVRFEENIVFNSNLGIIFANQHNARYNSFNNNLFFDLDLGISLPSHKTHSNEIYYNTWLNVGKLFHGDENKNDFMYNVLMNVPQPSLEAGVDSVIDYNAYYNSPEIPNGTNALTFATDSESVNTEFCFTIFQITNPTEVCVTLAVTTQQSPHASMGVATETAGRGVNDLPELTRTQAGFLPANVVLILNQIWRRESNSSL